MPSKIGVITYHHIINPGAVLQAYSVAKIFANKFPLAKVEIVDYRPLSTELRDLKFSFLSVKDIGTLWRRISRYFRFKNFIKKTLPLSSDRLTTDKYEVISRHLDGRYDLLVVGSDEIWKIEKGRFVRPFPNIYFLADSLGANQVSFAASANSLKFRSLPPKEREWITDRLSKFDLIGVRDHHTIDMMKYLMVDQSVDVIKVPDPTFYLEISEDIRIKTHRRLELLGVDFNRRLLGITFLDERISGPIFDSLKKQGYQIIALTVYHPHADVNLLGAIDPFEWATVFGFLDFCLTNLFHGTIFSLKSAIPFLSFDFGTSSNYQSKLSCLLDDFSMQDRLIRVTDGPFDDGFIEAKIVTVCKRNDKAAIQGMLVRRKQEISSFMGRVESMLERREK